MHTRNNILRSYLLYKAKTYETTLTLCLVNSNKLYKKHENL
jgi:hypothetical protein